MTEQELQSLLSTCQGRLQSSPCDLSQVSSDLFKAENYLRQLKIDSTVLSIYEKQECMSRCVKYNSQISQIKKSIRDKEQEKLFNDKIESKLKSSTSLLQNQGDNLEMSKRVSLESESIASNTMVVLRNQRSQLQKAKTNSSEVNENISKSSRAINSMQRHSLTNKLIMVLIIFLLIVSILLIGLLKLTNL